MVMTTWFEGANDKGDSANQKGHVLSAYNLFSALLMKCVRKHNQNRKKKKRRDSVRVNYRYLTCNRAVKIHKSSVLHNNQILATN